MRRPLLGTLLFIVSAVGVAWLMSVDAVPLEFKWAAVAIFALYWIVIINVQSGL
jgi:hypothetical protein